MLKQISLLFLLISLLSSLEVSAQVYLSSKNLPQALEEYISQTTEAKALGEHLLDGQSLFIMGSGSTTLALAVKAHIENPSKPLPESFVDLFGPSQDVDLVIDSSYAELKAYRARLMVNGVNLDGASHIDLVTLRDENKRGILGNEDWQRQNSDLVSTGLVKIAAKSPIEGFPQIFDTRLNAAGIGFSSVIRTGQNHYLDSGTHYEAFLAKVGKNPKAVSAVKFISNNIRFNLKASSEDMILVESVIRNFLNGLSDGSLTLGRGEWVPANETYVFTRIHTTALKAFQWSKDPQKTLKLYDRIGLSNLINLLEKKEIGTPENRYFLSGFKDPQEKYSLAAPLCSYLLQ